MIYNGSHVFDLLRYSDRQFHYLRLILRFHELFSMFDRRKSNKNCVRHSETIGHDTLITLI